MSEHDLLAVLREFVDRQDAEIQADIAFLTLSLLQDERTEADATALPNKLKAWLSGGGAQRRFGKAVSFIAVFEQAFAIRFKEEGWSMPRRHYEQVLADERAPDKVRTIAQRFLEQLPARAAQWEEVGVEWHTLRNGDLSKAALDAAMVPKPQGAAAAP